MFDREAVELGQHRIERPADAPVAADQVGVVVAEHRAVAVDVPLRRQVKEHRSAAEKRLEIPSVRMGIEAPQHR